MRTVEISPSILSADLSRIDDELALIRESGAKYVHIDIMDGSFVSNQRLSAREIKPITKQSKLINDVHIMIDQPWAHAKDFIDNGANILTFHLEACPSKKEVYKTIEIIKNNDCKVGISIKPETNVVELFEYLNVVDLVLIMSVKPGKGGQSYIDSSSAKIRALREYIDNHQLNTLIEVDGGMNKETAAKAKEAGVDIVVAGSYLFGHPDFLERVKDLINS